MNFYFSFLKSLTFKEYELELTNKDIYVNKLKLIKSQEKNCKDLQIQARVWRQ